MVTASIAVASFVIIQNPAHAQCSTAFLFGPDLNVPFGGAVRAIELPLEIDPAPRGDCRQIESPSLPTPPPPRVQIDTIEARPEVTPLPAILPPDIVTIPAPVFEPIQTQIIRQEAGHDHFDPLLDGFIRHDHPDGDISHDHIREIESVAALETPDTPPAQPPEIVAIQAPVFDPIQVRITQIQIGHDHFDPLLDGFIHHDHDNGDTNHDHVRDIESVESHETPPPPLPQSPEVRTIPAPVFNPIETQVITEQAGHDHFDPLLGSFIRHDHVGEPGHIHTRTVQVNTPVPAVQAYGLVPVQLFPRAQFRLGAGFGRHFPTPPQILLPPHGNY